MPIGTTNQGGYKFNYQSWRGDECRVYRLQNTPGKLLTPARWNDSQELFLDVNLPECSKDKKDCPWAEAVKISATKVDKDKTTLSYGINKDEYHEDPDAFRKVQQVGTLSPFVTLIRGMVADAENENHPVNVEVSSSASQTEGIYTLVYSFRLLQGSDSISLLDPPNAEIRGLRLSWFVPNRIFFEPLPQRRVQRRSSEEVKFTITTSKIRIDERNVLAIFDRGKLLAATTAPAYVPVQ